MTIEEQTILLKKALKRSPVGCAVSAWQQNEKGEYVFFGQYNHWCVCVGFDEQDRPLIWDSYDQGLKTLEKGFPLGFPQIYILNKEKKEEKPEEVKKSFWQKFWGTIKNYFEDLIK